MPGEGRERLAPSVRRLVVALWRAAPQREWTEADHRERFETAAAGRPLAAGVACLPTDAYGVPAEWAIPERRAAPEPVTPDSSGDAVLYLHGGGFIMGSIATTRPLATHFAAATGRPTLSLEYSLAPESSYPVPVQETVRCYRALLDEGRSPDRIVLAGDSAGGAITIAALLQLRQGVGKVAVSGC